ncbi:lysogenization regulator HflD [Aliidiomarina sedimenti]|uniref:High frequency lysogenization protein HflD homolog n=1 Tax=Aliidiomarina sedimenti TaxID=1933879 RepID=A0ABY0C1T6_9GAMM|nr:high frequency lysogenization protein HflD [Aliidiomarina sedimenti]RUO31762.1 lysogenization regulator HflD [Aliidiomarina sedimenti]
MSELSSGIWHQRMLAFSGVCLASVCVQQLARRGQVNPPEAAQVLIDSTLIVDAADTESIYQPLSALLPGLKVLLRQLDASGDKDVEQTRYVVGMLQLERRLARNDKAMNQLGSAISQIKRQRETFAFEDSDITANLGSAYSDIISGIGPRIQIQGDSNFLTQPQIQKRIRAMLLAGIRSAVLWRQLGGKRRQVVLNRKQMLNATRDILNSLSV